MLRIEVEEEADGRFIAEVPDLPGAMAYGQSRRDAIVKVEALALRILADRETVNQFRDSRKSFLQHERMAGRPCARGPRSFATSRMARGTTTRIAPRPRQSGAAEFRLCISRPAPGRRMKRRGGSP
jgi:predicted RNase H-like HicB family nuclease